MLRSVIICAFLCAAFLQTNASGENETITAGPATLTRGFRPVIVATADQVYTISQKGAEINITSLDPTYHYRIVFNTESLEVFHGYRDAVALGSGKIVYWGLFEYSQKEEANKRQTKHYAYKILLIDPKGEKNKFKETVVRGRLPDTSRLLPARVVPYYESFDFFAPDLNPRHCSPCRYDEQLYSWTGEKPTLRPVESPLNEKFYIRGYGKNQDKGYFFAQNFENGTAVIQRLTTKFAVDTQKFVNYTVGAVATNDDDPSKLLTAICYTKLNETILYPHLNTTDNKTYYYTPEKPENWTEIPITPLPPVILIDTRAENSTETPVGNATETPAGNATEALAGNATETLTGNATVTLAVNATQKLALNETEAPAKNATGPRSITLRNYYHVCESLNTNTLETIYNITYPFDGEFLASMNVQIDKHNHIHVAMPTYAHSYNITDFRRNKLVNYNKIANDGEIVKTVYVGNFTDRYFDVNTNFLSNDKYCVSVSNRVFKAENVLPGEVNVANFCFDVTSNDQQKRN